MLLSQLKKSARQHLLAGVLGLVGELLLLDLIKNQRVPPEKFKQPPPLASDQFPLVVRWELRDSEVGRSNVSLSE